LARDVAAAQQPRPAVVPQNRRTAAHRPAWAPHTLDWNLQAPVQARPPGDSKL
jgi:hypothetical protein